MKIEMKRMARESLENFIDRNGLVLEVRSLPDLDRRVSPPRPVGETFYANIKGAEIKLGPILSSESGRGATAQEAVQKYIKLIRCQLLVIDAYKDTRREINVPWLTDDLEAETVARLQNAG